MPAQKRTRSGVAKPPSKPRDSDIAMTDADADAPPCAQPQPPPAPARKTQNTTAQTHSTQHPKRPRLPPTATISKRPLLHPALPSPYASAAHPKILYITTTSPFVPACKRVRALLAETKKRAQQSLDAGGKKGRVLEANGRLAAGDVEAEIAAAVKGTGGRKGGEDVFVKATGRAIPRALAIGVVFQGEDEWRVRVEMGSVRAVDDVEVDGSVGDDEVPETRMRTLSSVTVAIGPK